MKNGWWLEEKKIVNTEELIENFPEPFYKVWKREQTWRINLFGQF